MSNADHANGSEPPNGPGRNRVPAGPIHKMVDQLVARGWTRKAIARELGQTGTGLKLGTRYVSQAHADTIEALLNRPAPVRRRRSDSVRGEAAYLPEAVEQVEDLAGLHRRLVEAGQPAQVASGIVSWLILKSTGEDPTSAPTRASYRKILAELPAMAPPPEHPERSLKVVAGEGKGTGRRVRGGGRLASVVALAIAGLGLGGQASTPTSARAATPTQQAVSVEQNAKADQATFCQARRRRRRAA